MPLYVNVPIDEPKYHDQKEPMNVDDDTFLHSFDYKTPGVLVRVYRFICFIVFLGPIRFLVTIFAFLLHFLLLVILPYFKPYFKTDLEFKEFAHKVSSPVLRLVLLSIGIVRINIKGQRDREARTVIANHLTMVDAPLLFYILPVEFIAMIGLKENPYAKYGAKVFGCIFVDRSKAEGVTSQIREVQNQKDEIPVGIFPEGRVTNGSCLIGFRNGAFVNDTPVQPITFRYKHWLMPESMATISWVEWNIFTYLYQLYSVPFYTVEATWLPTFHWDSTTTPHDRAVQAQLAMANNLGCPAYAKSSKGIAVVKREELEKKKEE